jgi:hypothetical protein
MVKGFLVELDHIGIAAFMFRVTDPAFGPRNGLTLPMKALAVANIRGDLLVAS